MKANKNKLIPELRFPEFQRDEEWKNKIIENVAFSESSSVALNQLTLKKKGYAVYGADSIIGFIDNYQQKENYISIVKDGSGVGRLNFCQKESSILGTLAYIKSLDDEKFDLKWIYYLLNTINFSSYVKGSGIPHIYFSDFKKENIGVPKFKEQQKIASCLSSLDQLITTQKEKLELLKNHKKGLMQNLFPQEGEKVPKYRFPEFLEDGYWKEVNLGEIGDPKMCKRIFKEETTNNPVGNIPFYKIGTFGGETDSYISNDLYSDYKNRFSFPKKGEILISASGTIGRLVVYDDSPAYFQDSNIVWIANNEKQISNKFLFYCYSIATWQTSDGGIIRRLYNADLKSLKISFPKNRIEQQKIASCLSSLDNLITAQTEKIEQLKFYKKGLMQGLFPVFN